MHMTAYDLRISDGSADVCSSDLQCAYRVDRRRNAVIASRRASVPSIVEECPHQSAEAIPPIVQPEFLGERPIAILLVVGDPIGGRHVVVGAIEIANLIEGSDLSQGETCTQHKEQNRGAEYG